MFAVSLFLAAALVPGATNPAVTQANIDSTVCVSGWTATIRPTSSYTYNLKRRQMRQFKLPGSTGDYEEDHLVPLSIGGHPTDEKNLWPQPWVGPRNAHLKDALELTLRSRVCNRTMTLRAAQRAISTNWVTAYRRYIGPLP